MVKATKIFFLVGVLTFSISLYFYFNYQFWTHYKTENFKTLIEYKSERIKGLRGRQILIHKDFNIHLKQIEVYAIEHDVVLIINQSYRSDKHSVKGAIVKPGKQSNHLAGFAIDFNIINDGKKYLSNELKRDRLSKLPVDIQNFINAIRQDKSLRWGGDFRNEDPIHIDSPLNLKNRVHWKQCSEECAIDYNVRVPKWKIWG
ncbi:M15 family metallopeptidase [Flammeovirga sp. EKP202]|uniref:M15 family metallopeptidase n=1 Tax=Flammeovirga sp. EKP202 TaxID=2770592 RepID=UPI00165F3C48|nr:M15 family metallopeptidase [Flammeovirga sp. EKP202]MBD0403717.1 M15 family metallopeptidase [Flammeovirga sp. EKP202]